MATGLRSKGMDQTEKDKEKTLEKILQGLKDSRNELQQFRAETGKHFEDLRAEIKELRSDLGEVEKRMDQTESRITEMEDKDAQLTRVIIHLLQTQREIKKNGEYLESQSCRKNIHGSEGDDPMKLLETFIKEKLNIIGDLQIIQAHRSLAPKDKMGLGPRSFIIRFLNYNTRQRVLMAAWRKEIYTEGSRIFFDQDYSTAIQKERVKYKPMLKILQEQQLKTHLMYLEKLKVFSQEGIEVYDNPQTAAKGLQAQGIETIDVSEDLHLDLDELLSRGGWKIAGGCKEGEAVLVALVTTLLQSLRRLDE